MFYYTNVPQGMHVISKNLGATSKFWTSERWHDASSIRMTLKYKAPAYKI
jgi:hypothetical protein